MHRFLKSVLLLLAASAALVSSRTSALAQAGHTGVAATYFDGWRTIVLNDRTTVLVKRAYNAGPTDFYYVPSNLHLALGPDGTPQFLFLKYTSEKREDKGGIQGALMHFLMEYGLSQAQMGELNQKLAALVPGGRCLGAVPLYPTDGETAGFEVVSATLKDNKLTRSLATTGKVPLMPGQRCAAAASLSANGAQLMAASFDQNLAVADCTLSFQLRYYSMVQGVQATMRVYGEKIKTEREKLTVEYHNTHETTGRALGFLWETSGEDTISYDESYEQFKFLRDKGYVKCDIKTRTPNAELNEKILTSFLQLFLEAFTAKQQLNPDDAQKAREADNKGGQPQAPGVGGNHFNLTRYKRTRDKQIYDRSWSFTAEMPVPETVTFTANLKEWYGGVKNNPRCIASVNLNDPFFSHRDVRFVLDLDAKEMFDEAVNYVTVNVRKPRSSGRDFEESLTIDAKYLKENGVTSALTYARGEDNSPEVYQYQAQWSLKGGNVFPQNPRWLTGRWEGVTLTPPVRPLTVELEGNFDDMKAKDVTRVSAQIHYYQFEREAETNIQLSPAKGQAVVPQKLFMDRDRKGYAYRLVYNHKTLGKLATPWQGNVSDGYIYAALPEDLLTNEKYREDGKNALNGVIERVLNRFQ